MRLLLRRPGDAEARLLLASVYRRGGELDRARDQLAELLRMPTAFRWLEEIEHERIRLVSAATPLATRSNGVARQQMPLAKAA